MRSFRFQPPGCLATDAELQAYRAAHAEVIARLAAEAAPPRFPPGAPVACNMGGEWARGQVLQHYYREDEWPLERWTPYQVRLGLALSPPPTPDLRLISV